MEKNDVFFSGNVRFCWENMWGFVQPMLVLLQEEA
jgi:hypothetical protein